MPTFLDIGVFPLFNIIWPFMFVTVVVFAFFAKMKFLGDNKAIHALIAVFLGLVTLFSGIAIKTINLMAPWFVLLLVFGIFVVMVYMSFGIKEDTIISALTTGPESSTFGWWVLSLTIIIGVGSLAAVISEEKSFAKLGGKDVVITPEGEVAQVETAGFFGVLTNPKVLGFALVMLIGMFTVSKMVAKPES